MLFDEDGYIKAIFLRDVGKAINSNKHNLFTLNYNKNKNASFGHVISALKNNKELHNYYERFKDDWHDYIDELSYPHCYSTFLSIVFINYLLKISEAVICKKSKQNILALLQNKSSKNKFYDVINKNITNDLFINKYFHSTDKFLDIITNN